MAQFMHITLQGLVYSADADYEHFGDTLVELCKCLHNVSRELSFNALYQGLGRDWQLRYDIPDPFGDERESLVSAVVIVDLDNDVLILRKKYQNRRISLSKLRQRRVSILDMEPFELPPSSPIFVPDRFFPATSWEPEFTVSGERFEYISRMLNDFAHQWRHLFRSRYNDKTFRRLAWAILRIASLDFTVREVSRSQAGAPGPLVWVDDLPKWKPAPSEIIEINGVSVVLCQHMAHSITAIGDDLERRQTLLASDPSASDPMHCTSVTYLVLSLREVFLYQSCVCGQHGPHVTKSEPLFNGVDKPSKRALEYLMMLAPSEDQYSRLHNLPIEIQDMILESISDGPVEPARIGCMLSLGSAFKWEYDSRIIERQDVLTTSPYDFPVDSQIWFDGYPSGLSYTEHLNPAFLLDSIKFTI